MDTMRVISLGWGVQSFTLAAMAALGELGQVDAVLHADTGHERQATYKFIAKWTPWLEVHNIRVVNLSPCSAAVLVDKHGGVMIPAFTVTPAGRGQIHRQCTGDWKISPMRRWLQANRNKAQVELLIGISLDEFRRMRDSDVKYIQNSWPLIDKKMTRNDCINWLKHHDLEVPSKSACTFCPFQSKSEWQDIMAQPQDKAEALAADEYIRSKRPPYSLFIHPARVPLSEVDLRTDQQKGQLDLADAECSGMCFL